MCVRFVHGGRKDVVVSSRHRGVVDYQNAEGERNNKQTCAHTPQMWLTDDKYDIIMI